MKRLYLILIFSVLVLAVNAQHYFGISLGGLTTYQVDNVDNTTSRLGGGGEIGGIYQLQRNNFLFQTGLGLNYSVSILGVDSMPLSANMIDTEGATFTYKGIVYDRVDRANATELFVPLMFGFNVSSFYALIGAKFVYPLMATTRQTALLTTYGDYNGMFYEDFFDMPQHGYANGQPAKTIGQAGTIYDELAGQVATKTTGASHLNPLDSVPLIINAIKTGVADLTVLEEPVAVGICGADESLTYFRLSEAFDVKEEDKVVSIGVRKADTALRDKVNAALLKISEETRQELMLNAINNQPSGE